MLLFSFNFYSWFFFSFVFATESFCRSLWSFLVVYIGFKRNGQWPMPNAQWSLLSGDELINGVVQQKIQTICISHGCVVPHLPNESRQKKKFMVYFAVLFNISMTYQKTSTYGLEPTNKNLWLLVSFSSIIYTSGKKIRWTNVIW